MTDDEYFEAIRKRDALSEFLDQRLYELEPYKAELARLNDLIAAHSMRMKNGERSGGVSDNGS